MNLLDVVGEVRRHLEENGRLSLRMLRRQFDLDDDALADVIEELVDVQRFARREESVLVWSDTPRRSAAESSAAAPPPTARAPSAYTPKHLADRILQSRSTLEGERKQVTVMFADVKGSMKLAGENETAAQWHARAAEHAGFDSPAECLRHWEKVRELLERGSCSEDGTALRLRALLALLNVGWRLGMERDRVVRIFSEGKALARKRADARTQVGLHYVLGLSHALSGEGRRSIPIFEEGVAVADATGDPELRWSARTAFDFSLWLLGDLKAALRMNDEQMTLAERDPGPGRATVGIGTSDTFWHRGIILADMGRFEEAKELFRRSQERAHQYGENEVASWVDFWLARALARAGEIQAAPAMGRRAIESAEKIGSTVTRIGGYTAYGTACVLAKDWLAARENLEHALDLTREQQGLYFLNPYSEAGLAEAYLGLGDETRASELADQAIETARRMQMAVAEIRAHLARARVSLALDERCARDAVESELNRASDLVRSTGAQSYAPQVCVERARLARPVIRCHRASALAARGAPAVHGNGGDWPRRACRDAARRAVFMKRLEVHAERSLPVGDAAVVASPA